MEPGEEGEGLGAVRGSHSFSHKELIALNKLLARDCK